MWIDESRIHSYSLRTTPKPRGQSGEEGGEQGEKEGEGRRKAEKMGAVLEGQLFLPAPYAPPSCLP